MLDEVIEDSSGYSRGSDRVSNWSDEDSISDTDGYDTVYTSSGGEYSEDSSDEDGIPSVSATEEERAELDSIRELQVSEQASAVASNDSINEASIAANSKESEKASQEESDILASIDVLDHDSEEGGFQELETNIDASATSESQATYESGGVT